MLGNLKITKLLEKTAEGTAVPGGGSIAALNAAISASLSEMVANLTIGKKGYEAVEKEMKTITAAALNLRKKLVKDIDKDATAYNAVMKAFKMPQNTEKQKDRRNKAIQAGLKNASLVPLGVARDALSIMDLAPIRIVVLLVPANHGFALLDALLQPAGLNRFRARFTPFAPCSAEWVQFSLAERVLQAELEWIEVQLPGNPLHVTFYRPESLRDSIAAIGT